MALNELNTCIKCSYLCKQHVNNWVYLFPIGQRNIKYFSDLIMFYTLIV